MRAAQGVSNSPNRVAAGIAPALQRPSMFKGPAINRNAAQLLTSMQDAAPEEAVPHALMAEHLGNLASQPGPYQKEFAKAHDALSFAADLTQYTKQLDGAMVSSLDASTHKVAGKVLTRLNQRGNALFYVSVPGHGMMMELIKETNEKGRPNGLATMRLYDTMGESENHIKRENGKHQTVYEVRGVKLGNGQNELGRDELAHLLRFTFEALNPETRWGDPLGRLADLYTRMRALGTPHNPPEFVTQAMQTVGNCSHKCVLAYMRNNMSDAAYSIARATLLEHAASQFSQQVAARAAANAEAVPKRPGWFRDFIHKVRLTQPEPTLQEDNTLLKALINKAAEARRKANRAAAMAAMQAASVGKPWYGANDKAAVSESLRRGHAKIGEPLFALRYAEDTRRWMLATIRDNGGIPKLEHTPLVFDRDTGEFHLPRDEQRFASLDHFAAHMRDQGMRPHNADVGPPPSRGEQRERWRANSVGARHFLGAANVDQVEHSLQRQRLDTPKYLLSYDPNRMQWTFSYAFREHDQIYISHYPLEHDAYRGEMVAALGHGEARAANPLQLAETIVERARAKMEMFPADLDA